MAHHSPLARRAGGGGGLSETSRLTRGTAGLARLARRFAGSRRSAVAVELAIVALPFFLMVLGTLEVSYDLYVQSALNYVVVQTSRKIWSGQIQYVDGTQGGRAFVTNEICPNLTSLLDCSLIQVNIVHMTTSLDFYAYMKTLPAYVTGSGYSATLATSTWAVCTAGPGSNVFFQAIYSGPTFVGGFFPSYVVSSASGLIHPTYAQQAFVNENFTANVAC